MNRRVKLLALAVAGAVLCAGAITSAGAQQPQPVKLDIRIRVSNQQRAALQAAADRGVDALRQYIWRTRGIYNYYWPDIVGGPDIYF